MDKMNTEKAQNTSKDMRRASKPLMEKRRRARMNESLQELKALLLDTLHKDSSRHSKLEKADILEMTVRHLRQLQTRCTSDADGTSDTLSTFRAGYNECANEVSRYLMAHHIDGQIQLQIMNHLASNMHCVDAPFSNSELQNKGKSTCDVHPKVMQQLPLEKHELRYEPVTRAGASVKNTGDQAILPQLVSYTNTRQLAVIVSQPNGSTTIPVIPIFAGSSLTQHQTATINPMLQVNPISSGHQIVGTIVIPTTPVQNVIVNHGLSEMTITASSHVAPFKDKIANEGHMETLNNIGTSSQAIVSNQSKSHESSQIWRPYV